MPSVPAPADLNLFSVHAGDLSDTNVTNIAIVLADQIDSTVLSSYPSDTRVVVSPSSSSR